MTRPGINLAGAPIDVRSPSVLVVVSLSGGKDSTAASLLLREHEISHRRVFADVGWEHPATYRHIRTELAQALGPIDEVRAELDFVELVRKKGLFPSRVMRYCTQLLKLAPLRAFLEELGEREQREIVNVVGIRRAESRARARMKEWEWSDSFDCWIWRPLVEWTAADVEAIHRDHGVAMNPLYALGASRVGCWPCIHARKSEIALVASTDPDRIAQIAELEAELDAAGAVRDREMGRPFVHRSMFSYGGGGRGHRALPILQAVEWARSGRGEWQPPGAGDGCARHGLCSVDPEGEA